MRCPIWYHFFNLKTWKTPMAETNNQAKAWNFNKSTTHPWVFFKFFKLYKWFPDHAKHIFPRVLKRVFSPQRFFFFFWKKHVRGLLQKSFVVLTLSWRRPLSYRNRSIDLQSKSIDWFICDNSLRHERINVCKGLSFYYKLQIVRTFF